MHPIQPHRPTRSTLRSLAPAVLLALAAQAQAQDPTAITINGQRVFQITAQTTFELDGTPISAATAATLGPGFSTLVLATNVPDGANQGQAQQVQFDNLARGPVTATDPLSVLNQPLTLTADTVLEGFTDPTTLVVGDLLEVSGYLDADSGVISASRIALLTNPTQDWKLVGQVSQATANGFAIGAQAVDSTGVTPTECPLGVIDGVYIELEALPNPAYTAASVLDQLIELHCEDPNFGNPPPGTVTASLEGLISALPDPLPDPPSSSLLGVTVQATAQTEYRGGGIDDLDVGVRVEAEGSFDSSTQILTAHEIRFTQAQARFMAPLDSADITPDEGVTIMGNLVAFTPQTRDEDGLAANGLSQMTQVEVRAFVDSDGSLYASRIRERGNPDLTDTRLQGPVAEIAEPVLTILGNSVDTSAAQFRDHEDNLITAMEFYALLQVGMVVSAEDALYDPVTASLIPARIHLEDAPAPQNRAGKGIGQGISRGTVTALGGEPPLFQNGFE
ncbi:MAG: hypothetical protein KDI48_19360 [Xanthomonadales bacterium]|nr:hypothetical protein [Xanthomonadales bacterium]